MPKASRFRKTAARGALACVAVALIAGCASATKTTSTPVAAASSGPGGTAGMNMGSDAGNYIIPLLADRQGATE